VVSMYRDIVRDKVVLARHRIWHPSANQPLDLDQTIGNYLREMHRGYRMQAVFYDPYQLHDLAARLRSDGIKMVEYPQSVPNLTQMGQNLFELIKAGNLVLYSDDELRLQVGHAVALQSSRGWRIAKEKTSHKIDAVVALAMGAMFAERKTQKLKVYHGYV